MLSVVIAECCNAKCRNAKCRYADCQGTIKVKKDKTTSNNNENIRQDFIKHG